MTLDAVRSVNHCDHSRAKHIQLSNPASHHHIHSFKENDFLTGQYKSTCTFLHIFLRLFNGYVALTVKIMKIYSMIHKNITIIKKYL